MKALIGLNDDFDGLSRTLQHLLLSTKLFPLVSQTSEWLELLPEVVTWEVTSNLYVFDPQKKALKIVM